MAEYGAHYEEIRAAGADVVVVSVDSPNKSAALRHNLRLPFVILSDTEKRVVKEWGIYNSRERGGIAIPSVFILDRRRTVQYASIDSTFARIPTEEIVRILQSPSEARSAARKRYLPRLSDFFRAIRNNIRGAR